MAVDINVLSADLAHLLVRVQLTGLTAGTKYDVFRMAMHVHKDDAGTRVYERFTPDRREYWSKVAHRIGWTAPGTTAKFKDYEAPLRPFKYFVCPSSAGGPHEWQFNTGKYPLSRGVLDSQVIHFAGQQEDIEIGEPPDIGHVIVRSTWDLALYVEACVVEIPDLRYAARGTEHAVLGNTYPVYIADRRESVRGSITLLARDLGTLRRLRNIVFPTDGMIRPVVIHSGTDPSLLTDDLWVAPLDVSVEQATQSTPDLRYVHVDFLSVEPGALIARVGDNDDLVNEPVASFSVSDDTPARGDYVTLTDTSSGQYDEWNWSFGQGSSIKAGEAFGPGPHKVRWSGTGKKSVRLRISGSGAGADSITKTVTVH